MILVITAICRLKFAIKDELMKKHFILLGKAGLIYYSWLFIILFIGLINAYETTAKFSWPSCILIVIFCVLLIYTWQRSYLTEQKFVLPYRTPQKIKKQGQEIASWKAFKIGLIKIDPVHQYYYLYLKNKKS